MVVVLLLSFTSGVIAEDYYVCAANGKGKKATKEKPAKDLGNIVSKLEPGDTVHIAGGTYLGRGKSGTCSINAPVKIIGGYDETFSNRDPWGKHKTIFSGENASKNWKADPALSIDLMKYRARETFEIVVDGIIFDHADRNRYAGESQDKLLRKANPRTGANPSPESGGLSIRASKVLGTDRWKITVRNCVVMNTAPTQGALSVMAHENSQVLIENNLVINNTGTGIEVGSNYMGKDDSKLPYFVLRNNTVLFTWLHDPFTQSFSGCSFAALDNVKVTASHNVFAFADRLGINNESKASIELTENLILANIAADYLEFDTKIGLEDLEDEAEHLHEDSADNVSDAIKVPVPKDWAGKYASRVLFDRNAAEADIKAQKSAANELRSILGLPLQAGTVAGPETSVWLNRISIDDALNTGRETYHEMYGCSLPRESRE
jgi:hypothetical protein